MYSVIVPLVVAVTVERNALVVCIIVLPSELMVVNGILEVIHDLVDIFVDKPEDFFCLE